MYNLKDFMLLVMDSVSNKLLSSNICKWIYFIHKCIFLKDKTRAKSVGCEESEKENENRQVYDIIVLKYDTKQAFCFQITVCCHLYLLYGLYYFHLKHWNDLIAWT